MEIENCNWIKKIIELNEDKEKSKKSLKPKEDLDERR